MAGAVAAAVPTVLVAQGRASSDSIASARACVNHVISGITVRPQFPFYVGLTGQYRRVARGLQGLHATTRETVVRVFLQLHVGQKCTEIGRTETERVLRAQPFIADAHVTAYDDGQGGVHIDVFTVDEISLLGTVAARNRSPFVYKVRAGENNLDGLGLHVAAEWDYNQYYRDRFEGEIADFVFLNRPWFFGLQGERDPLGGQWSASLSQRFLTDLQTFGWLVGGGSQNSYFGFLSPEAPNDLNLPSLEFARSYAELGGVVRLGQPGRLGLFGVALTRLQEAVAGVPVIVGQQGLMPVAPTDSLTLGTLSHRYGQHQETRLNALFGFRSIRFERVVGFDALHGPQDLPVGFQIGSLFGRSMSQLSSKDNDIFVSASSYAGYATRTWFAAIQAQGEGRNDRSTNLWDGILASGRAAIYWKPNDDATIILDEEYSLGTRSRIPLQLSFADPRGGVRGYLNSLLAGGERSVSRLEVHYALPSIGDLATIGLAPFFDAGQLWALDAPFGVTTKPTFGAGIGLLVAFPPNSRHNYRLDIAFPLEPDSHTGHFELRFSTTTATSSFWIEPYDLGRSREPNVPATIFNYP
jgi:hypothetical protein